MSRISKKHSAQSDAIQDAIDAQFTSASEPLALRDFAVGFSEPLGSNCKITYHHTHKDSHITVEATAFGTEESLEAADVICQIVQRMIGVHE